jgi:hypothetical protein
MNSVIRIIPAFDYNERTAVYVYTTQKINDTSTFATMSVKMVDSVLGTREYVNKPLFTGDWANYNTYDAAIGAYKIYIASGYNGSDAAITGTPGDYITPGVNSTGSLDISIQFNGEDVVNFTSTYTQNGWQTGIPQGLSLSVTDCDNNLVRVFAQTEAKIGDNTDFANTDVMQLWDINANTQIPFFATLQPFVYVKIWDSGYLPPATSYNFRLIGASSISGTMQPLAGTTDFIDYNITTPVCPILAVASNDDVGDKPSGSSSSLTVSTNDTLCSTGGSTFALVSGSQVNVTSVSNVGAVFSYTPISAGPFSFKYNILCDGVVTSEATVSGTAVTVITADAVNDSATTTTNTPVVIIFSSNDTLCN